MSTKKQNQENLNEGHRERHRSKYVEHGLKVFKDHEILELILFYCFPRRDTNKLAHKMIREFGDIITLFETEPVEIARRCEITENAAVLVSLIPEISKFYYHRKMEAKDCINNAKDALAYCRKLFSVDEKVESFYVICLDTGKNVIAHSKVSEGIAMESAIYPSKVAKEVLRHESTYVIFTHNHPGGTANPSAKDIKTTQFLKSLLNDMSIQVLDHIIITKNNYYSFSENKQCFLSYNI